MGHGTLDKAAIDGRQGGLSASISIGMGLGDMAHPPVARLTLDEIVESKFCYGFSVRALRPAAPAAVCIYIPKNNQRLKDCHSVTALHRYIAKQVGTSW